MSRAGKPKAKLRIKIILLSILVCMVSLLLCGATIFLTYFRSSSPQIQSDISFFIEETLNNFSSRITLAENVLMRVRSNNILMQYLDNLNSGVPSSYDLETIHAQFEGCVDIYASQNTDELQTPFLENVYLFSAKGGPEYVGKSMFTPHTEIQQKQLDKEFRILNREFLRNGSDIHFYPSDGSLRLAAILYDETFRKAGTLIYDIRHSALLELMSSMGRYKDSFWMIFDRDGQILEKSTELSLSEKDIRGIMNIYKPEVCVFQGNQRAYLSSTRRLGLGFRIAAGIPKNYINIMLYDSIQIYIYLLMILAPVIFFFTFIMTYHLTKPLKIVEEKIKLVEQGAFDTKLPDFNSAEFSDISHVFNAMTSRIDYLINDVYEKKIIIKESELQFLQAQMDPHFMFNVLNTIALQAKLDGNEQVYQMIHSFSLLTQAKIYKNGREKIHIREELEYVNFYLYLQKCRYEDKLTYSILLEKDEYADYFIPKLSIQPIVENSMVHGIEPNQKGGHIQVTATVSAEGLQICVEDNGVGFPETVEGISPEEILSFGHGPHTHIGILNVHKIIRHFYGENYGVRIFSVPEKGTTVWISLPVDQDGRSTAHWR